MATTNDTPAHEASFRTSWSCRISSPAASRRSNGRRSGATRFPWNLPRIRGAPWQGSSRRGTWAKLARQRGLRCHIGRLGTAARVHWARSTGATRIDSALPPACRRAPGCVHRRARHGDATEQGPTATTAARCQPGPRSGCERRLASASVTWNTSGVAGRDSNEPHSRWFPAGCAG